MELKMGQARISSMPVWVAWMLAIPVMVVAAIFGVVVLMVVAGMVAMLAIYFGARIWWRRRQMRKTPPTTVIDAEYVVVREPGRSFPHE